jgi:hypothetical protein
MRRAPAVCGLCGWRRSWRRACVGARRRFERSRPNLAERHSTEPRLLWLLTSAQPSSAAARGTVSATLLRVFSSSRGSLPKLPKASGVTRVSGPHDRAPAKGRADFIKHPGLCECEASRPSLTCARGHPHATNFMPQRREGQNTARFCREAAVMTSSRERVRAAALQRQLRQRLRSSAART